MYSMLSMSTLLIQSMKVYNVFNAIYVDTRYKALNSEMCSILSMSIQSTQLNYYIDSNTKYSNYMELFELQ